MFLALMVSVPLSGCILTEEQVDLDAWMQQETSRMSKAIKPLPPMQPYEPAVYDAETQSMVDPFRPSKIMPEARRQSSEIDAPDEEAKRRRNNPLEQIPLESFKMVGYLEILGIPIGVVQAEKFVKQIKVGDFIGFDYGEVVNINEHEIDIRETFQDSDGEWVQRSNTLMLQGQEEKK